MKERFKKPTMKVELLKSDKRFGIKKGEIYDAFAYPLDPMTKVQILDKKGEPICNVYRVDVKRANLKP